MLEKKFPESSPKLKLRLGLRSWLTLCVGVCIGFCVGIGLPIVMGMAAGLGEGDDTRDVGEGTRAAAFNLRCFAIILNKKNCYNFYNL